MSKQKKIVSLSLLVVAIVLLLLLLRSCSKLNSTDLSESDASRSPWINQGRADSSTKKEKKKAIDLSGSGLGNGNARGQLDVGGTKKGQEGDSSTKKIEPQKKNDVTDGKKKLEGNGNDSGNKASTKPTKPTKPEEPAYQFERIFKETYLAWSNLQAQALIDQPEYVADMQHISKQFSEVSTNARKKRYKGALTEEEVSIYSFYGDYAKEIETLSKLLSKKKFDEAETLYQKMLVKETTIKE